MTKNVFSSLFILNAIIFFFQSLTKNLYPPLLIPVQETFGVDGGRAGLLVTLVFLGYGLARFPSGIMGDRLGYARTVLIGTWFMAAGFLLVGISPNYLSLAIFTFILGIASGIYVTAGYTLAVVIGTRGRAAFATAFYETFGSVASVLSPLIVSYFVLNLAWNYLFLILGVTLFVVGFIFSRNTKITKMEGNNASTASPEGSEGEEVIRAKKNSSGLWQVLKEEVADSLNIFKDPAIREFIIWSILVGGFSAFTWLGVNSFRPTYLVLGKGYEYEIANSIFALIAFSTLFTKVALGWLTDRLGTMRVMAFSMCMGVLLYGALVFSVATWQIIIIMVFLGAFTINTNMMINSYVLRNMPEKYQGTGFGFFCTAYTAIYSIGPSFSGFISENVGLNSAIFLTSLGAIIALLLVLGRLWRQKRNVRLASNQVHI